MRWTVGPAIIWFAINGSGDLDRRGVIRGPGNGPILEGARLPPCRGTADSG